MQAHDQALIQIVDRALSEAAVKSGAWLLCRPGCFHCCLGPFPISQLDAWRLRRGLSELSATDPARAAAILQRARAGDELGDDDPCPVLDPATGTCDLYAWRPMTCRTFGPPVQFGSHAVGVCELCFDGATDEEIAACSVEIDGAMEDELNRQAELETGASGLTTVAECFNAGPLQA